MSRLGRRALVDRAKTAGIVALFLALLTYAAWPWLPFETSSRPPRTVVLYGFSILGECMNDSVLPAFQEHWMGKTGEQVEFLTSFSGSGTITNQILSGAPAAAVLVSLALDADRLAGAGLTSPGSWRDRPEHGVVNRSPFVILVRPGNPKGIHDFDDLTKQGVEIVHPDPLTSGGANWAIVAEYGAGFRGEPGGRQAGTELLGGIWRNVVAQAASARAARTQFENGFGDALITYEQEAVWDRARGKLSAEIVYPKRTILSEHTMVVVERNVEDDERDLIEAFAAFLWSRETQERFVEYGFRSVDDALNEANSGFGRIEDPFRITDFGGWTEAKADIVDGLWRDRVLEQKGP